MSNDVNVYLRGQMEGGLRAIFKAFLCSTCPSKNMRDANNVLILSRMRDMCVGELSV